LFTSLEMNGRATYVVIGILILGGAPAYQRQATGSPKPIRPIPRKLPPEVTALPTWQIIASRMPIGRVPLRAFRLAPGRIYLCSYPHPWSQVHAWSQSPKPIRTYCVSLLPTFVVIDQVGNILYRGNSVSAVSEKVAELVSSPSIPANNGSGYVTVQR